MTGKVFISSIALISILILFNKFEIKSNSQENYLLSAYSDFELNKMGLTRTLSNNNIMSYKFSDDAFKNKAKRDYRMEQENDILYKMVGSYYYYFEGPTNYDGNIHEYDFKHNYDDISISSDKKTVKYIMNDGAKYIFELDNSNSDILVDTIKNNDNVELFIIYQ